MAEKEYIEREAAIKAILGQPPEPHYPEWYYRDIKELPAADVVEKRYAKWVYGDDGTAHCSWCGNEEAEQSVSPYCSHCGAFMDEMDEPEETP